MKKISGEKLIHELDLKDLIPDTNVEFCCCIHKIKDMGSFSFIMLRTGKYVLQSVYEEKNCPSLPKNLCEGAYVKVNGTVRSEKRAANGIEIMLTAVSVLSVPKQSYPLHVNAKKLDCSIETSMAHRSVALRHPHERAVFKISEGVVSGFREFMLKEGFTEIHSPKIVASGAEGGANIFKLKYFGRDAFLAQSPQFYKQTCVAFFDRVFEIAPVYRAEKHNSTRHLNEYIGLDFEMAYISDMSDVMQMETAAIKYIVDYLKNNYDYELSLLGAQLPEITEIPSLTFFEALDCLGKEHNQFDLDPTDEVRLCKYAKEKYDSEFIFITKFPAAKRPFYAMNSPEDEKLAESFDLLFRGLEITTGGQRIHDYDTQIKKLEKYGIEPDDLGAYTDIHKYGMPPHGGLGIGLERLVMKLLNLQNIRQASLFPRDIHHLDP